jgi:hypothetical protein
MLRRGAIFWEMPKPVAELLEATRPLEERILEFLSATPGQAYSLPEIYVEVERLDPELRALFTSMWLAAALEGRTTVPTGWATALSRLVASGAVGMRALRGTDYYWAADQGEP